MGKVTAFATDAPLRALSFGALGGEATPVEAIHPLPAYTPGAAVTASASLSRPADTTAYAVGDLIANSTTAGAVAPIELTGLCRGPGEGVRIERARLRKSGASLTNAAFRVHLFRIAPTVGVGDNGAFDNGSNVLALSDIQGWLGTIDVALSKAATIGAGGQGVSRRCGNGFSTWRP